MKKKKESQAEQEVKAKDEDIPDLANPTVIISWYASIRNDLIYQAELLKSMMVFTSLYLKPMKEIEEINNNPSFIKDLLEFNQYDHEEYTINLLNEILETKFLQQDLPPYIKDPSDKEEIKRVVKNCEYLSLLNNVFCFILPKINVDLSVTLLRIKRYSLMTLIHAGLIDGFSRAKLKERARNVKNARVRTKNKLKNMEIIKTSLEKHHYQVNKSLIGKLTQETGLYDRRVKDLIKEIIKQTNQ